MKKRILAILMVLAMAFTLLPLSAFAADTVASGTCGDALTWTLDSAGTLTISGSGLMSGAQFKDVSAQHEIKAAVLQKGVTSICYDAFMNCTSLTSLELPSTLTSIAYDAFSGCTGLTKVSIPEKVTEIGDAAFCGCSGLKTVNVPSGVTSISTSLFSGCTTLETVTLSGELTEVGASAFYGCTSLKTLTVPDTLSSIGTLAFAECTSLTSINIPESVTKIGDSAFRNCRKLKSLCLPEGVSELSRDTLTGCTELESVSMSGVTEIVYETFQSCSSLKTVTLGSSLTSIGKKAFGDESTLTDVNYEGTKSQWNQITVEEGNAALKAAAIHYHYGTEHKYEAVMTVPPCETTGLMTYTCTMCDDTYTQELPIAGHQWDDGTVTTAPTVNTDGVRTYTCSACGKTRTETIPTTGFPDVLNPNNYYYTPVLWAVGEKITTGFSDGNFHPDEKCTRGQIVTFLWRAYGSPEPKTTQNPFTDVSTSSKFYKAILWAVEEGITTGYTDNTFRPGNYCTRAHAVTFIYRAAGTPEVKTTSNPFPDVRESSKLYAGILWASENGITGGYKDGTFRPDNDCTRAQIVTFLWRADQAGLLKSGE